jgi:hypothetical protein
MGHSGEICIGTSSTIPLNFKGYYNIAVLKLIKAKDKKLNKGSQELFLTKIQKIIFINGSKEAERKWHIPTKIAR